MDNQPKPEDVIIPEKKPRVKKPKERFTSREQIVARIDKFSSKAADQREKQRRCYEQARYLRIKSPNNQLQLDHAAVSDKNGDKWGKKAERLERKVLPVLRSKLAEFDTEILPGVNIDKSVGEV